MLRFLLLDHDSFGELVIDIVSAILDGHGAAALEMAYHSDRLAAVASKGKQKAVQLFIISFDPLNDVFFSVLCVQ